MNRLALCLLAIASVAHAAPLQIRVATYNASLNRDALGQLASELSVTTNAQARQVAETLQRVRPDIVLINEFDVDPSDPSLAVTLFHDNYLAVSQNGQTALSYPYRYAALSNTGVPTGKTVASEGDFDNNGVVDTTPGDDSYGQDCFGFGLFTGQFSFVVYSKYPIQTASIRTFRLFKWKDMPGAALPDDPGTPTALDWYTPAEKSIFRLSSKNHVDLPIEVKPGHVLHLLTSHPTPPSFDGAEDRNGRRNYDEIRLWADYISNKSYLRDDANVTGGLSSEQRFIILGDMNADPLDGDSFLHAINQLRNHALVNAAPNPSSPGGTQQSQLQGGVNLSHQGNPAHDTSDFFDGTNGAGNLRVDHVLPSKLGFSVAGSGVFWPLNTDPTFPLVSASDHRLVYLDLNVLPIPNQAVREFAVLRQGNDVVLTWRTQGGVTYQVEQSTDLATWSALPAIPINFDTGAGTATAIDVNAALGSQKFYRLALSLEEGAAAPAASVWTQPLSGPIP